MYNLFKAWQTGSWTTVAVEYGITSEFRIIKMNDRDKAEIAKPNVWIDGKRIKSMVFTVYQNKNIDLDLMDTISDTVVM